MATLSAINPSMATGVTFQQVPQYQVQMLDTRATILPTQPSSVRAPAAMTVSGGGSPAPASQYQVQMLTTPATIIPRPGGLIQLDFASGGGQPSYQANVIDPTRPQAAPPSAGLPGGGGSSGGGSNGGASGGAGGDVSKAQLDAACAAHTPGYVSAGLSPEGKINCVPGGSGSGAAIAIGAAALAALFLLGR